MHINYTLKIQYVYRYLPRTRYLRDLLSKESSRPHRGLFIIASVAKSSFPDTCRLVTFWNILTLKKKSFNFQLKWSLNSKWGQCKLIRWLTLKLPPFAHVNNLELYCPVGCAGSRTSLSKPKRMADIVRDIKLLISTKQIKTIVLSFLTCYLTIFGHWN